MPVRLYIGNLPKDEVDRQELQAVFADAGSNVTTKVIKDRKTGKCRGFGFVTVNNDEQADEIIGKYNGYLFKETPLKIEKALPRNKGQEEDEREPVASANTGEAPAIDNVEKSSGNKRSGKKSRRGGSAGTSTGSSDAEGIRPDPRWASELEKLKQMLAAQTTNG